MKKNRTVIITGAFGHLGQALSRGFDKAGYRLILLCRTNNSGVLNDILSPGGPAPLVLEADLTSAGQIEKVFREIRQRGLKSDVLVNNAAIQSLSPLEEIAAEEWDKVMAVNLRAAHLCTRLFVGLREPGDYPDYRSIVNIASIEGENPAPNHAHYDASKAALIQYTKSSALELGSGNIRVNCVSPGLIDRPGLNTAWPDGVTRYEAASPLNRLVTVVDVSETVLFLCSSAAAGITGVNLRVDAGIAAAPGY